MTSRGSATIGSSKPALSDLPLETLEAIICYIDTATLLQLQSLSTHFHTLASAEIYRSLDFNITCSEADVTGDLATQAGEALQTISTSEYNYARHVKSFRLGYATLPSWMSGCAFDAAISTRAVFDSASDASKFLNTSILHLIRKASILETFRWDIPVELSGHVYRALHKLPSLCHLYVRLDVGPTAKPAARSIPGMNYYPPLPPAETVLAGEDPPGASYRQLSQKWKKRTGSMFWVDRRAFSGFATLRTLEITRLTTLESLKEMRQCIKACSASLRSLTLTIDPSVGAKAHRSTLPPPPNDLDSLSDTEELEDEELLDGPIAKTANMTEADRRQEKLALEGVLADLFDLQSVAAKSHKLERRLGLTGGKCFLEEDQSATIKTLESVIKSLREEESAQGKDDSRSSSRLEKYKIMRELADLYISQHSKRPSSSSKSRARKSVALQSGGKPSTYAGSSYPVPSSGIDCTLDNFNFEQFLDGNTSLSTPISVESPVGNTVLQPWTSYQPSYPSVSHGYPLDPVPPLPSSNSINGTISSSSGLLSKGVNKKPLNSSHYAPYTSSIQQSNTIKPSSSSFPGTASYKTFNSPYIMPNSQSATTMNGKLGKSKYKKPYMSSTKSQGDSKFSKKYTPTFYDDFSKGAGFGLSPSAMAGFKHSKSAQAGKGQMSKFKIEDYSDTSSTKSSFISDEDSDEVFKTKNHPSAPLFVGEPVEGSEEDFDIDMDHPDDEDLELIDDHDTLSDNEETENHGPRKRMRPLAQLEHSLSNPSQNGRNHTSAQPEESFGETPMDQMYDYVRTTHGIQLETFRLQHVPLKASIVGRALDLQILQHITLLDTGPQDAFWALLVKLTSPEARIALKSIHTDNVSFALLRYLSTFCTLEELFIHERRTKKKDVDPGLQVDVKSIREQALRPHLKCLRRVMIRNERNDSWDMDFKTLHLLGVRARSLTELAISLKTQVYHGLLQILPAFKSLRTLHLIALRGGDRNTSAQMESLAYTVDSMIQCADLKLRYVAIADKITEVSGHALFKEHLRKMIGGYNETNGPDQPNRKGKGKATEKQPPEVDVASEQDLDRTLAKMQAAQRKLRTIRQFEEVKSVKVFGLVMRTGKL